MEPEQLHPALSEAYNTGNLDAMLVLYAPNAVFAIKPGQLTSGPAELRTALARLIELRGRLTIQPRRFLRSGDSILALGQWSLTGRKRDGSLVELGSRFADVLTRQPDGRWLMAIDNGFATE
jgi:ketosteroid isomerase-like protein